MLIATKAPVDEDKEFPHNISFKGKPKTSYQKNFDDLDLAKTMYRDHLPWLRENCDNASYVVRIGYEDVHPNSWSCRVTYKFVNVADAVLFRLRF